MSRTLMLLEKGFVLISLFLFSEGVIALVLSGGADEFTISFDGTLLRLIYAVVHLLSFCFLLLRWKKVLAMLRRNGLIVALIVFIALSFLWSDSGSLTLRRSIALVGTSFFGAYLASRYTFKEQVELLGWIMGAVVILSLVFVVAVPSLGIATGVHEGAWRGIFTHKNGLGSRMVLSGITFWVLALDAKRYRWLLWGLLGSSVMILIFSQSLGSLLGFVLPLSAFFIYRALRWNILFLVPFGLMLILVVGFPAGWMWVHLDQVLIALGKDPSLTGRTELWDLVIQAIYRRPFLGYGYQTFWQGLSGESAFIWRAIGLDNLPTWHAHNGILQLFLDTGLLGVVLFLLGFWKCLIKGVYWIRCSHERIYYWPLLYMSYMAVNSISEANLLSYNSLTCVLYFSMAFSLGQPLDTETLPQNNKVDRSNELSVHLNGSRQNESWRAS